MQLKLLKKNIVPLKWNGNYKGVVYNGEDYAIGVMENTDGIIVDVWIRDGELEETHTYWNWSKHKKTKKKTTTNSYKNIQYKRNRNKITLPKIKQEIE